MNLTEGSLSRCESENFQSRFLLLVDRSGDVCWNWLGPRHSSGAGRYLWKARDGGNGRYVGAHRVAYYVLTGELPPYLRNLCGNRLWCRPLHWWTKPTGRWKPKPRKTTRGRVQQLPGVEVEQIRLLASLSRNEDEIGRQFGLTRRQVAGIALGRLRSDVGGRIRPSRFWGIKHYHDQWEKELLSMRAD